MLRGVVMVLMTLDHTRMFFSNARIDPLDLDRTTVALFLTRWVTHFCAPVFVFLAGTGAFLSSRRGRTKGQLSWFLLSRGLWLVVLEVTVIRWFGWGFMGTVQAWGTGQLGLGLTNVGVAVIWAIGCSMVVLSGLVWLPVWVVTLVGLSMIGLHNLSDTIAPEAFGGLGWLWRVLHAGGSFPYLPGHTLGVAYPLVPWIGVMAAGYGFARVLGWESQRRRRWLTGLGVGLVLLFLALRVTNLYGDPNPWRLRESATFSVFACLHCHKYPPSLAFLLMTLGPALLVLRALDRGTPGWLKPALVFGRVPLFFYLLHLPLISVLSALSKQVLLGPQEQFRALGGNWGGYGFDLPIVFAAWIIVVVLSYPVCRWFAGVKQRRRDAWLSYL